MTLLQKFAMVGVLTIGLTNLSGCGGKTELGPAASTPKVDPKKLEDERRKSMEMGKLKMAPAVNQPAPTQ